MTLFIVVYYTHMLDMVGSNIEPSSSMELVMIFTSSSYAVDYAAGSQPGHRLMIDIALGKETSTSLPYPAALDPFFYYTILYMLIAK